MPVPDTTLDPNRLTAFSHGAGCGCKISPAHLEAILQSTIGTLVDPRLLVGYNSRDDAAVYDLGDGRALISTTDFFSPIVDDPFTFGRIAAANALSDVYAMGGRPLLAVAILGWPVEKLGTERAQQVVEGGRTACHEAGIPLAGGHSIDAPEPFFGLAVTGEVAIAHLKRNNTAKAGDILLLTKSLGTGVLSTALKRGQLAPEHATGLTEQLCTLNHIGAALGSRSEVSAMTDVTGFGLLGHLLEMCEGSGVHARITYAQLPLLPSVLQYIAAGCYPDGAFRNWKAYGQKVGGANEMARMLIGSDPQTNGGLLIAVEPGAWQDIAALITEGTGAPVSRIGVMVPEAPGPVIGMT